MKKIILFLIFAICLCNAKAQKAYERDTVIQVPGKSIEQIYEGLRTWFISSFEKDSRDIIQVDDPANGSIVTKLHFPFVIKHLTWAGGSGYVTCMLDLKIREGRYKIKLYDFIHTSTNNPNVTNWNVGLVTEELPKEWEKGMKYKQEREVYKRLFPKVTTFADAIILSIDAYMKSFTPSEEEDW